MKVVRTIADLRAALDPGPGRAPSIGLVPTMGALHGGHLSLIAAAREGSELVVVSLFVNPAQFGRDEDLERYPRDEASDIATAEAAGVDLLFAPDAQQMYPDGFDTWIDPGKVGTYLEGSSRPGHFRGVATICTKLFLLVKPHRAYFGRKDAQQVAVVKQLVRDLDLPVEIVACPTVRDPDGLALSSRNAFLSPEERRLPSRCRGPCRQAWRRIGPGTMRCAPRARCSTPSRACGSITWPRRTSTGPRWRLRSWSDRRV